MSTKDNKENQAELIIGFVFGIAMLLVSFVFLRSGSLSDLFEVSLSSRGRGGGVPFIFFLVLGIYLLYNAIRNLR